MPLRRLVAVTTAIVLMAACGGGGNGGLLAEDDFTDATDSTDATDLTESTEHGLPAGCGDPVDGPGMSRAGAPGPIVFQEADGAGLVVVDPDGRERGRIDAPPVSHGYAVGSGKALYAVDPAGLLLVDAERLEVTPLPGPVIELTSSALVSGGGRQFVPLTNSGGDASAIVDVDVPTATDLADVIGGGGAVNGIHLDDAEETVAVFTGHGVWVTDTNFLEDAAQLDARANGRGDISADGCALAYFRGSSDATTIDVVVAAVDDAEPGTTVASVTVSSYALSNLQWVGRRLLLCDDSGAAVIDPEDGSVDPFGSGRCADVVRDLHRTEAIVNVGDTVDTHWFHVGAEGQPQPLEALAGYNATGVSVADLVPLHSDFGEPYLVYSFADHAISPTEPLPDAQSSASDDLMPGSVIAVETRFDGTTRVALAVDLRTGKLHTVAAGPADVRLALPAAAPDGSAAVRGIGAALAIVPLPLTAGPEIPIGEGTAPVWTVAELTGGGSGGRP